MSHIAVVKISICCVTVCLKNLKCRRRRQTGKQIQMPSLSYQCLKIIGSHSQQMIQRFPSARIVAKGVLENTKIVFCYKV